MSAECFPAAAIVIKMKSRKMISLDKKCVFYICLHDKTKCFRENWAETAARWLCLNFPMQNLLGHGWIDRSPTIQFISISLLSSHFIFIIAPLEFGRSKIAVSICIQLGVAHRCVLRDEKCNSLCRMWRQTYRGTCMTSVFASRVAECAIVEGSLNFDC